jgi:hypothetical protein
VVANISARTLVTAIVDGKYPKYLGLCHNIIPGYIKFFVSFISYDNEQPFSGGY